MDGRIPVHGFSAIMAEFARGRLTGAQAQAAITTVSRDKQPLDAAGVSEVNALLATVTGTAVAKLARAKEIDDVLVSAEYGIGQYDTPAKVKARLGV